MKKRGRLKKAQVNIIVVVLLILLMLVIIVVLWNVIVPLIRESSEEAEIGVKMLSLTGSLKYYSTDDFSSVNVTIKRGSGSGSINGVKIAFKKADGVWIYENKTDYPDVLESVTYFIQPNDVSPSGIGDFKNLEGVSFYFIYGTGRSERVSREMDSQDEPEGGCSGSATLNSKQSDICLNSYRTCSDGEWVDDYSGVADYEASEVTCDDFLDNDCDGDVDCGLVSWWEFELGRDFEDSVDDNDGTEFGNARIVNNELVLDGPGDYVVVSNRDNINIAGSITISAWVNQNEGGTAWRHIIYKYVSSSGGGGYLLWTELNKSTFYVYDSSGNPCRISGDTQPVITNWRHVVGVHNDGDSLIYVDGNLQNTISCGAGFVLSPAAIDLHISTNTPGYFNGTIDNIMIFNRSLNVQQIVNLNSSQQKP